MVEGSKTVDKHKRPNRVAIWIPIITAALTLGYLEYDVGLSARVLPGERHVFDYCNGRKKVSCIVDGETVWYKGEKIRLRNIDAPKLYSPRCVTELTLAKDATATLADILSHNEFRIVRRGTDRYGQTLGMFLIGNTSASGMLITQGLARPWRSRKESWC